jgi:Sigma-70, region 4
MTTEDGTGPPQRGPVHSRKLGRFASPVEITERRAAALRLRKLGYTYDEIAKALGVSGASAHKYVQRALHDMIAEPAEEVRQLELAKLDTLQLKVNQVLDRLHPQLTQSGKDTGFVDDGVVLAAIDRAVRISESRRKLLGLDAPQIIEHLPIQIEINGIDVGKLT